MSRFSSLVLAVLTLNAPAADPAQDVREAALEWTKAVTSQNRPALERILADDLTYAHPDGITVEANEQYIASVVSGAGRRQSLELRDVIVHEYEKIAVLSAYLDSRREGRPAAPVRIMQMYIKAGLQWRLAASAATDQTKAAPAGAAPIATLAGAAADPRRFGGAEAAVRETALAWTQAMVRKDRAAIEPLLAEKLLFAHSNGGPPRNRLEHLALTERNSYESLTLSNERVRVYENGAVLTANIDTKYYGREPFRVRTIQIFVRTRGVWQLAAFQSTRVSSEQPGP